MASLNISEILSRIANGVGIVFIFALMTEVAYLKQIIREFDNPQRRSQLARICRISDFTADASVIVYVVLTMISNALK